MMEATVSWKANFVHLHTHLGVEFWRSMFSRHIDGQNPMEIMVGTEPSTEAWQVEVTSKGEGDEYIRITSPEASMFTMGPVHLMHLMSFIREHGVTDHHCWLDFTFYVPTLDLVFPPKLAALLNEPNVVNVLYQHKQRGYPAMTHHFWWGTNIRSNGWLAQNYNNFRGSVGRTFCQNASTIDLSDLVRNRVTFHLIQGAHYEHQEGEVMHIVKACTDAVSACVNGTKDDVVEEWFHNLWLAESPNLHPGSNYTPV